MRDPREDGLAALAGMPDDSMGDPQMDALADLQGDYEDYAADAGDVADPDALARMRAELARANPDAWKPSAMDEYATGGNPDPLAEDGTILPGGEQIAIDDLNPSRPDFDALMRKARPDVYDRYQAHPEEFRDMPEDDPRLRGRR